jgi:signal transduction histidine kinase
MIEHLAQNAQEATGPAGRVELRLLCRGDLLVLEITDDGCGMTAEFIQHRLFKPFDTTKGKAGMGIGVYESLHIASSMGGRLTVDSRPGKGSTFRIQLPLVPLGEAEGEAPAWEKTA